MEPDSYFDYDPNNIINNNNINNNNINNNASSEGTTNKQHTQFLDLTNGAGGVGETIGLSMAYNDDDDDDDYGLSNNNNDDNDDVNNMIGGDSTSLNSISAPPDLFSSMNNTSTMQHSSITLPGIGGIISSAVGGGIGDDDDGCGGDYIDAAITGGGEGLLKLDPSPLGRVVETGHEHTGRWTKEEHDAFLSGLKMYGKEWKKVAAKVKTRTVVQTRTHAQKYFQKLSKATEGKEGATKVQMGTASDSKKGGNSSSGSTSKKKQRMATTTATTTTPSLSITAPLSITTTAMTTTTIPSILDKISRTTSVASAAQVISTLSGQRHHNNITGTLPPLSFGRPLEASPPSPPSPPRGHGFHQTSDAVGIGTMNNNISHQAADRGGIFQPTHGFSSSFATTTSAFNYNESSSKPTASTVKSSSTIGTKAFPSSMKIIAPDHDSAIKRGKFPEPSPAACGKRKLAEIAAARMLAGVLSSEPLLPPQSSSSQPFSDNRNITMQQQQSSLLNPFSSSTISSSSRDTLAAAVANHMDHRDHNNPFGNIEDIDDGMATPPPEEEEGNNNIGTVDQSSSATASFEMLKIPNQQGVVAGTSTNININNTTTPRKPMGLSLQIVNPESLGISHEEIIKRKKDGNLSPQTPWEGQLQALVR
jgi:SHAQKYF class myb-like DNA-binding protein